MDKEILRACAEAEKSFVKLLEKIAHFDEAAQSVESFFESQLTVIRQLREKNRQLTKEIRSDLNLIQHTNSDCD